MGLTQAKTMNDKGEPYEVKGGYLAVVEGRVWKGVVRRSKDNTVLWVCDHIHSRPEYNARHPVNDRLVWEYSALNCGREACIQWNNYGTADGGHLPTGVHGNIELSASLPLTDLDRANTKFSQVGEMTFVGHIALSRTGSRSLDVHFGSTTFGTIDPDNPTDDSEWPDLGSRELAHWVTAAGLLLDSLHGLIFREPRVPIRAPEPDYEIIRRLTPKRRSQAKKGNPHVRPRREGAKRMYEVVDGKGKVIVTLPHRGKALKELEKLEAKTDASHS